MMIRYQDKIEGAADRVPERKEIDSQDQWNVSAIYANDEAWDRDFGKIDGLTELIEGMRGQLTSARAVNQLFEAEDKLNRLMEKLSTYAHLREDEDTANTENQARKARILSKGTEVLGRIAWMAPEILSHSEEELKNWMNSEALKENRYVMVKLLRKKAHTLSDKEEMLLSRAEEIFLAPYLAFNFLTDADIRFPDVTDSEGRSREMSKGRYTVFMIDRDRRVRHDAFNVMYDTYGTFKNTLACTLSSKVKVNNYLAKTRNFGSAMEASLHDDNVPVKLYETLIEATHDALPKFYEYMALRKRLLGLRDLDMYDLYVPIIPEYDIKIKFGQAREWVTSACEPLGTEYVEILKSAFEDRWMDIYENRGKRSGAYSSGCYDSMPYLLLNYQETLNSAFTLAHELGHSMHTWLAQHTQPYRFFRYPIFIAEIPSTLNEALLLRYLLEISEDPRFRAYLLNHLCDSFKGTVYRQTMFAEFEKLVHEMDADSQPLTPDLLTETYYKLNENYYGPDIAANKKIGLEWSRIPHFYYNFYVYKYATSFCASQIFAERVLDGGSTREQYLDLLRAGGSADPLELIGRAGVDLTRRGTLESAFHTFGETVKELGKTLDELDH